ncbi:hypothetical protein D9757_011114 [Collybiopsis confluens]|uniref:ubiquitinyl hydrolase 1 n=1 Tax=Collybiopsis confluens TaxID=2823264 RepID=A0A8H5GXT6_9AGAR|nr:hypothetical protein D9757_011114 [Collybiopsis confluens]
MQDDPFCPFIPTPIYNALKSKKQFIESGMIRNGQLGQQQEDAEEFLGFYLEGLEEELVDVAGVVSGGGGGSGGSGGASGGSGSNKGVGGGRKKGKDVGEDDFVVEEEEEEDGDWGGDGGEGGGEDGWLEVGKRNRTVVTRTIKSTDSPISRIFGGKFRTSLRVPGSKESAIVEDWRSLRVDIQPDSVHTIQDAISHISTPQAINLSSSSSSSSTSASTSNNPTSTSVPREGSQQILIEALPPVLVVHLKRFEYNTDVGGVVKVGKEVAFGPELVVGEDVLSGKGRRSTRVGPGPGAVKGARYKLFGVIYHHGISASGGHYTLDVLHPSIASFSSSASSSSPPDLSSSSPSPSPGTKMKMKMKMNGDATTSRRFNEGEDQGEGENDGDGEGWLRIDDELVSDVKPEDVFAYGYGSHGSSGGYGGFDDGAGTAVTGNMRCAYLLFYRRVG